MSDVEQKPVHRIALGIEYDGSKYYGWQRQNEVRSVQEKLEKALSQVANEPVNVLCAGRTDAGVHGTPGGDHDATCDAQRDDGERARDGEQRQREDGDGNSKPCDRDQRGAVV